MGNPGFERFKGTSKFGQVAFWFGADRMFVEAHSTNPHNPSDPNFTPPLEVDGGIYAAMFVFAIEHGRIVRETYHTIRKATRNGSGNVGAPVSVEDQIRAELSSIANEALRDHLHDFLKRSAENAEQIENEAREATEKARLNYEAARTHLAGATMRTNAAAAALIEATRAG